MRSCLRCGSAGFGEFCSRCGGTDFAVDPVPAATLLAVPGMPESQPTPLRPRPPMPAPSGGGRGDGAAKLMLAITGLLVVLGLIGFLVLRYLEPARRALVAPASSTTSHITIESAAPPDTTAVPAPATVITTVTVPASNGVPQPTRPATTAAGSAVSSLPSGSWITVLDSMPKSEFTLRQAEQRAAAMRIGNNTVSVIDSDAIPGLNGGYWALGVPGLSSRESAADRCAVFNREVGGQCYPRQVE